MRLDTAAQRRLIFALVAALGLGRAGAASLQATDLAELSLEQLADIVVTSVSRREERLADAPASIYVITPEDIRRSGATSLPEALRLAPNLEVARADVNQYAISARGFNNVLANNMLVLIDGRTVYTPLFSGVFWEAQDVLLEDVERIEVISGSGATLWGVNAVNGVINVITRPARETQGTLVTGGWGNRESGSAVRYGGAFGASGHYRIYAKYADRDASQFANGMAVRDASNRAQAGFRADWEHAADQVTVQGDTYIGNLDQMPFARDVSGSNLLARWSRDLGGGQSWRVQAYYDATRREHPQSFHEDLDTLDIEGQYGVAPLTGHKLLAGAGYRQSWDRVGNSAAQAFLPADRTLRWAHVFAQDDIALSERLELTVGAKIETNVYTGGEFLPNIRLAYRLDHDRLLWGALSRAVRAPSRIDRDLFVPGTPPFALLQGGPGFKSEISNVAEIGFRSQPAQGLTYAITAFHHEHNRLRSYEFIPGHPVWGNEAEGRTSGVEAWGSYSVTPAWRLNAGGVAMRQRLHLTPASLDPGAGLASLGNDPSAWWTIRSSFDLTPRHEFDVSVRHSGPRPNPNVPAYTAVDARLGWNPTSNVQLSLVLQNIFDPSHPEWGAATNRAEFERAVFVKVLWRL